MDISKLSLTPSALHFDARGLLIPDDIVSNTNLIKSNPAHFWSSNQFWVRGRGRKGPEKMHKLLSSIPDHHFCLMQSLCLDLGWHTKRGFLKFQGVFGESGDYTDIDDNGYWSLRPRSPSPVRSPIYDYCFDRYDLEGHVRHVEGDWDDCGVECDADHNMEDEDCSDEGSFEYYETDEGDDWSVLSDEVSSQDEYSPKRIFKELMDDILRRGNKNLVVKILWNTTVSIPLQTESTWNEELGQWGLYYTMWRKSKFHENHLGTILKFKDKFRELGYDEERVRLITRINWVDNWPGDKYWNQWQWEEYEEDEPKIWMIDPLEKKIVWRAMYWEEGVRLSYGLMWDPFRGHYDYLEYGQVE